MTADLSVHQPAVDATWTAALIRNAQHTITRAERHHRVDERFVQLCRDDMAQLEWRVAS